jgi:hypothetical protein
MSKGFTCDHCNGSMRVWKTSHPADGITTRYRECENDNCPRYLKSRKRRRHRIVTEERERACREWNKANKSTGDKKKYH